MWPAFQAYRARKATADSLVGPEQRVMLVLAIPACPVCPVLKATRDRRARRDSSDRRATLDHHLPIRH